MAYRMDIRRPCDEALRQIAQSRLAQAAQSLQEGGENAAHDARKRLKEVRALLRLVYKPLGKKLFTRYNHALRDLARQLAEERDAQALLEAWQALQAQHPKRFAGPGFGAIHARLQARCNARSEAAAPREALLAALDECHREAATWPLAGSGFALLRAGLRQTYGDARRALKVAQQKGSDETLHEWRKRVKDHWYHTRLLQQVWPTLFKARRRSLETLAEALGDDHDLALLQGLLHEAPEVFGEAELRDAVAQLIEARRQALQQHAFAEGRRLFAQKPEELTALWGEYWRIAQH